jgi:hypothetical protein
MSYSPILIVQIFAGTLGLLSGTAAMLFRKGSPRHVLARAHSKNGSTVAGGGLCDRLSTQESRLNGMPRTSRMLREVRGSGEGRIEFL